MNFEVTPLEIEEDAQLGEEAEVYGYNDCEWDCLRWVGNRQPIPGCGVQASCSTTCWF